MSETNQENTHATGTISPTSDPLETTQEVEGVGLNLDEPLTDVEIEALKAGGIFAGETVEQEIQRKGLTAPRVTPADVEANIASEHYFTAADGVYGAGTHADRELIAATMPQPLQLLTFCVLVLRNGFTVQGVSACASPENFNAELGQRIARTNAVNAIWPLMGYALREKLSKQDER